MRWVGVGTFFGGFLGAIVGVIAHFASRTVPSTFGITGYRALDQSDRFFQTFQTPLVHPSWWPSLYIAIAVGILIGAFIGFGLRHSGLRVVRS